MDSLSLDAFRERIRVRCFVSLDPRLILVNIVLIYTPDSLFVYKHYKCIAEVCDTPMVDSYIHEKKKRLFNVILYISEKRVM